MLICNASAPLDFPCVNSGHTLPARMNLHFAKMADMAQPYFTTMLISATFLNQK